MNSLQPEIGRLELEEFRFFQSKILSLAGISLGQVKLDLVQSRLRTRLLTLGLSDFKAYREYLERLPDGDNEWEVFVNSLTTNKTDWFRESEHFDFVVNDFIPVWKTMGKKHLSVWCAASSTGEEPYSLALILSDALKDSDITFEVIASDIDTKVLAYAKNGVYAKNVLNQIPLKFHKSCFCYGSGEISEWMKVRKEIKSKVTFLQINLAMPPYPVNKKFDLILCRNVLIYFSPAVIQTVINGIYDCGEKESVLMIGHAESIQTVKTSWKFYRPTIYFKGKFF